MAPQIRKMLEKELADAREKVKMLEHQLYGQDLNPQDLSWSGQAASYHRADLKGNGESR